MQNECHTLKFTQFLEVCTSIAFQLASNIGPGEPLAKYHAFHERIDFENEYVVEDLCSLAGKHFGVNAIATRNLIDRQKELEWIKGSSISTSTSSLHGLWSFYTNVEQSYYRRLGTEREAKML